MPIARRISFEVIGAGISISLSQQLDCGIIDQLDISSWRYLPKTCHRWLTCSSKFLESMPTSSTHEVADAWKVGLQRKGALIPVQHILSCSCGLSKVLSPPLCLLPSKGTPWLCRIYRTPNQVVEKFTFSFPVAARPSL